ncbi:hypothetical protein Bca52824_000637 [Brassica carinata]|uniref:Uncharacterized protein n=1 Tax=Brassica carinata TaxID=52824 RepID=A0A8X8BD15_BRACI|nr:hypothetical protein Bca52824_000637 [Brassica carinata]
MPTDEPMTKTDQSKLENYLARDKAFDPFADMGELHCLDVFRRSLLRSSPKPEPRLSRKRWSSEYTRGGQAKTTADTLRNGTERPVLSLGEGKRTGSGYTPITVI